MRWGIGAASVAIVAYGIFFRPRMLRWGATDEEVHAAFPGAELVPGGTRSATMATTIDAPPSRVWPWLVQMGYGRAGWYSWDLLDNLGRRSARTLHKEWQNVAVGSYLTGPNEPEWLKRAWEVAALEPERFLGLRANLPRSTSLWGFLLEPLDGRRTRLVVSGYWRMEPRLLQTALNVAAFEWMHWIMQCKQFTELRRRAEEWRAPGYKGEISRNTLERTP